MHKIGITENGDAGRNFTWVDKMDDVLYAILITKSPTDKFIKEASKFQDKAIIHLTCTGWGGTKVEPHAFKTHQMGEAAMKLRDAGFNEYQIVLRLDPIILTPKWTGLRERVSLETFKGISARCRFSFMDMYAHVAQRFRDAGFQPPYETFNAPREWMLKAYKLMAEFPYLYESCAEKVPDEHMQEDSSFDQVGCISRRDLHALTLRPAWDAKWNDMELEGPLKQRPTCLCPRNKTELLDWRGCYNGCLYCYWNKPVPKDIKEAQDLLKSLTSPENIEFTKELLKMDPELAAKLRYYVGEEEFK